MILEVVPAAALDHAEIAEDGLARAAVELPLVLQTHRLRVLLDRAPEDRQEVRGAIEAALWLVGKPAGRYAMADVLGLK